MERKYIIVRMQNRKEMINVLLESYISNNERTYCWCKIRGNSRVSCWHKTSKKQLIKNKVFPFIIEMLENGAGFTKEEIGIKNIS